MADLDGFSEGEAANILVWITRASTKRSSCFSLHGTEALPRDESAIMLLFTSGISVC